MALSPARRRRAPCDPAIFATQAFADSDSFISDGESVDPGFALSVHLELFERDKAEDSNTLLLKNT